MSSNNLQLPSRVDKIDDHERGDGEALNKRLEAIQDNFDRLSLLLPSVPVPGVYPPWHMVGDAGEPAFGTSWQNVGAPDSPLRFFRDPMGFVYIAGVVERTAGADTTVFTLPEGYRPAYRYVFTGGTPPGGAPAGFIIGTDGTVVTGGGIANGTDYSIDLPPFRVV